MKNITKLKRTAPILSIAAIWFLTVATTAKADTLRIAGSEKRGPRIEVVFALDTTGSMSGLINAAKEKIWSIASSMTQAKPTPDISIGLVAFRDRGDDYVTRLTPLTRDIDAVYEQLMSFQAGGGGDTPESVNQALHEAVTKMNWSRGRNVYKVVFLVGDSPPHNDYQDDVSYKKTSRRAGRKGIFVNTIQCGQNSNTTTIWKEIARMSEGDFFKVEQSGGAMIASTPFDREMAELSTKLDGTRLYYGKKEVQKKAEAKKKLSSKIAGGATVAAQARRASFNHSAAGEANFLGDKELISDVSSGKVAVTEIKEEELPQQLKAIAKDKREDYVKKQQAQRKAYTEKLRVLSEKRQAHLKQEMSKSSAPKGLSQKVYDVVRKQAVKQDIEFESDVAIH